MFRLSIVCVTLIITLCLAAPIFARTWKSADGKFTVEAEFVEATGPNVKLKKSDGKEITVMMSQLSQADRDFVIAEKKKTSQAQAAAKAPAGQVKAFGIGGDGANVKLPMPMPEPMPAAPSPVDPEEPPFNPEVEAAAKIELEKLGAKCVHVLLESDKPIFKIEFADETFKSGDVAKCIPYLKRLPSLRDIHLGNAATDADFKAIGQLKDAKRLEEVVATFSEVTDAGFLELKNLPRLECINVIGAKKPTKAGAEKALAAMPKLRVIYLDADDGIQQKK